jgi:hypothetical protein
LQETISANDKDFKDNFGKLIMLATKLAYQFEAEYSGGDKTNDEKITSDYIDTLSETFLDDIFGTNAKISRKDYLEAVATKAGWIFNSKDIRDEVDGKRKRA